MAVAAALEGQSRNKRWACEGGKWLRTIYENTGICSVHCTTYSIAVWIVRARCWANSGRVLSENWTGNWKWSVLFPDLALIAARKQGQKMRKQIIWASFHSPHSFRKCFLPNLTFCNVIVLTCCAVLIRVGNQSKFKQTANGIQAMGVQLVRGKRMQHHCHSKDSLDRRLNKTKQIEQNSFSLLVLFAQTKEPAISDTVFHTLPAIFMQQLLLKHKLEVIKIMTDFLTWVDASWVSADEKSKRKTKNLSYSILTPKFGGDIICLIILVTTRSADVIGGVVMVVSVVLWVVLSIIIMVVGWSWVEGIWVSSMACMTCLVCVPGWGYWCGAMQQCIVAIWIAYTFDAMRKESKPQSI